MGDTLKREFSLEPVDTGRTNPMPGGGATPITRPSFISAFLANSAPALAGGLMSAPGMPFGTGLAGALAGIEEQKRYSQAIQERAQQFGMQQQDFALRQVAEARATQQAASTQALQTAETERITKMMPYETAAAKTAQETAEANLGLLKGKIEFYGDPNKVDSAVDTATAEMRKEQEFTAPEKAKIDSGKQLAKLNHDWKFAEDAISSVADERIKAKQAQADTSLPKMWWNQFVKEYGRPPNTKEITDFGASGRIMGAVTSAGFRQDNYFDVDTQSITAMSAADFREANKKDPGRFIKDTGQVGNALKAQSNIRDIRGGINQMRDVLNDPTLKLDADVRGLMSLASKNPEHALQVVMAGMAGKNLNEAAQDYVIAHATLVERAMSLRGLQGQGAGSESQRQAIVDMLPGFASADVNFAKKQLKTFEDNVDNVETGIPKLGRGKRGAGAGGMVKMQAPNGQIKDVDPREVEHYKALGATVVQ